MHQGGMPVQRCACWWITTSFLARVGALTLWFTENDAFKGSNLRVIGISPDSVEAQDTFVKSQNLTVSPSDAQTPTFG